MGIFRIFGKTDAQAIEVHVNRLSGIYSTTMEIGKDISEDTVQRYRDQETGALYVYVMLVEGQQHKYLCKNKDAWLAATAKVDEQVRRVNEEFLASLPEDDRPLLLKRKFQIAIPRRMRYGKNRTSRSRARSRDGANPRSHFE